MIVHSCRVLVFSIRSISNFYHPFLRVVQPIFLKSYILATLYRPAYITVFIFFLNNISLEFNRLKDLLFICKRETVFFFDETKKNLPRSYDDIISITLQFMTYCNIYIIFTHSTLRVYLRVLYELCIGLLQCSRLEIILSQYYHYMHNM